MKLSTISTRRLRLVIREKNKIELPDGVDAEELMKVLNNPEMAALLGNGIKG